MVALDEHIDDKLDRLKMLTKKTITGVWEPPPSNNVRQIHMEKTIIPRITFHMLKRSLDMRGVNSLHLNNDGMIDLVAQTASPKVFVWKKVHAKISRHGSRR